MGRQSYESSTKEHEPMNEDKERKDGAGHGAPETEHRPSDRPEGRRAPTTGGSHLMTPALWMGDPFGMVRRFAEDIDRVFENFRFGGGSPARGFGHAASAWTPQVECFRRGDRLVIRADLPGLSKDDIHVELKDDAITIHGERKHEHEEKHEGYFRSERSYGSFMRTIPLPQGVDAEKADASYRDGVLEITLPAPRQEERGGRRIQVKG
jgi:HSP20 family protein